MGNPNRLRQLFRKYDVDCNGKLSKDEFVSGAAKEDGGGRGERERRRREEECIVDFWTRALLRYKMTLTYTHLTEPKRAAKAPLSYQKANCCHTHNAGYRVPKETCRSAL